MSHIAPGELEDMFGGWSIELFADYPDRRAAAFVLTRR
jgi:hypothetical protein